MHIFVCIKFIHIVIYFTYTSISHTHIDFVVVGFFRDRCFQVGRLALHQSLGPGSRPRVLRHYPGVLHRIILYPVPVAAALFTRHLGKSTRLEIRKPEPYGCFQK